MSHLLRLAGVFGVAVGIAAQAHATGIVFTYNGFATTTGLSFVGDATTTTTSDGTVARLASAVINQSGAMYSTTAISLDPNDTFSTTFQFRFTNPGGLDPADGIAFILTADPSGLGADGADLGYGTLPDSVAIEFDAYNNGIDDGSSSNHVAIDEDGHIDDGSGQSDTNLVNVYGNPSCGFGGGIPAQNTNNVAGCMSNGDLWSVTLGYDGTNLSLSLQDLSGPQGGESSPFIAYTNVPIDIASIIGTSTAYVGLSAATASGFMDHDITQWSFADDTSLAPSTPEPGSIAMFVAGLGGLALLKRRVRRA